MMVESRAWVVGVTAVVAGCVQPYSVPNDSSYTDAGDGSEGDETTTTSTTSPESTSTGTSTTGTVDDTGTVPPATNFIDSPDAPPGFECDFWEDECPRGEKCMPYAYDEGPFWNASKCTPIARDPGAPGDPCTAPNGRTGGIDDCQAHAFCWNVHEETNMGECVAFCDGNQAVQTCTDPLAPCTFLGESTPFMLCLPYCDPVAQDCTAGTGCYPWYDRFICLPDVSGENGSVGDPCDDFDRDCDPGLFCAHGEWIPGCETQGCCSPFCDTTLVPSPCPDGIACVPWYEEGQALPPFESVGACVEAE
jgi:hypothetical protein